VIGKKIALKLAVFVPVILLVACTSASSEKEAQSLFVAPITAECVGAGPQRCMLVRENPDDEWEYFYDSIEGFDYQEGLFYELLVEEEIVDNPPADASSRKLILKEIVSSTPVAIKTVFIGPERVECEGEGPQECYQYKEAQSDPWLLYYDDIQGFEHEEGYTYELVVAETNIENPPAGGSSTQLTLIQEVDKSQRPAEVVGTVWALKNLYGQPVIEGSDVSMGISDERIGGFAGCNTYFGPFSVDGDQVDIGPLGATKKACLDPDLMAQEFTFLDALDSAVRFEFTSATELSLFDERGDMTMEYVMVKPSPLEGTQWELTTYNNGQNAMVSVLPDTRITALFEDGNLGGSSGCNNYSTSYEVDGDQISIGLIAGTLMMCSDPPEIMEQEQQYLAALQSSAIYKIVANQLELIDGNGALAATFTAAEPVSLDSTPWEVIRYNNGKGGAVSVIIGTRITANFDESQVNGSAGCNNYFGAYEIDGANISVGPLANTEKFCMDPEGIMEQEQQYLAALQTAATYRVDGDQLEMRTADGALAVAMVAVEPVSLENRPWQVTAYNNGKGGFTSVIIGTELSMLYEDGTVSGSAGCNNYNGSYELDSDTISVGPAATTRKFCGDPEGIMDQETQFLEALQSVAVFRIDGESLEMRTAEGSLAVGAVLAETEG
jgi:heat shock protein HslJ